MERHAPASATVHGHPPGSKPVAESVTTSWWSWLVALLTACAAALLLIALPSFADEAIYPNHDLTPGVVKTTDAKVVCRVGYTKDERHVTEAMKREIFRRYGFGDWPRSQWKTAEVDHLVSLELGGANDLNNLWPEIYAGEWGARKKDVIETRLHRLVCKGQLTLPEAQDCIRTDWVACFKRYATVPK